MHIVSNAKLKQLVTVITATVNKDPLFFVKWGSTVLLILGAVLTSFNIFPINVVVSLLGNLGWTYAGFKMKEPSLWSVSIILTSIYLFGVLNAT